MKLYRLIDLQGWKPILVGITSTGVAVDAIIVIMQASGLHYTNITVHPDSEGDLIHVNNHSETIRTFRTSIN